MFILHIPRGHFSHLVFFKFFKNILKEDTLFQSKVYSLSYQVLNSYMSFSIYTTFYRKGQNKGKKVKCTKNILQQVSVSVPCFILFLFMEQIHRQILKSLLNLISVTLINNVSHISLYVTVSILYFTLTLQKFLRTFKVSSCGTFFLFNAKMYRKEVTWLLSIGAHRSTLYIVQRWSTFLNFIQQVVRRT